jgi:hypothetical protein
MQVIKYFTQFLNEELNILKGPSDEETFNIKPLERYTLCREGKLDQKFIPSKTELEAVFDKMNPTEMLLNGAKYGLLEYVEKALKLDKPNLNIAAKIGGVFAIRFNNYDIKIFLINHGYDTVTSDIERYKTYLMYAAAKGDLNVVKYLVENKMDNVNISDHAGHTAIDYANDNGHDDIVEYLESKGAILYDEYDQNDE